MRRWLSQHVRWSVRSRRVAGRFACSERVPGHIPAISPLRPISPMESAIHDVHTALNRPGVTGTKSRRSAHCVDGDKDQTADAAEKRFEENDREGVAFEYEVLE
jgi:hypothetical protein